MDRTTAVIRVLIYTLIANAAVAVAKMVYGYHTDSIAMVSDGFHSLFDGISNVIGLVGVWIASHPPDRDHPYGHRKYETIFTIAIAVMIFLTCYQILRKVYESFLGEHRVAVTPFSFGVMILTMAVNMVVMMYEMKRGRELKSDFLIADARHTRSDMLASIAVIISLILTALGYRRIDAIIGIIITVFIARIGIGILKAASDILVDTVCIDTSAIGNVVNQVEGVRGCHDIRTRGTEDSVFLDLHVLVDPAISVERSHRIADMVESSIKERFPSVVDIVVHIEPEEERM